VRRLVLGTRGSALALWQARHVAARLREAHVGLEIEERIITTEGDLQQHAPLGPQDRGVFVRRIEQAMLEGEIDLAVHSLKDLPTTQPDALIIAAVPQRHDPRDALISPDGLEFDQLAAGTKIGTGSFRRRTQLLNARPDLLTLPVRGNVDTRVRKLAEGQFDAIVLALAGLQRLGIDRLPFRPIDTTVCLPAVGQGALAIETRDDDHEALERVAVLDHPPSHRAVRAERAFLKRLGGGCLAPATGFATWVGEALHVEAVVGDADGQRLIRDRETGAAQDGVALGQRLAERMLSNGAGELLEQARS
jgi:hydroxymethylbilane synthase